MGRVRARDGGEVGVSRRPGERGKVKKRRKRKKERKVKRKEKEKE